MCDPDVVSTINSVTDNYIRNINDDKDTIPCVIINDDEDGQGICSFCHQIVKSPVSDDYYDRCVWFWCENCNKTSILCYDYENRDEKCSRKINVEEFKEYCQKYKINNYRNIIDNWNSYYEAYIVYPLYLNYLIPTGDYDEYNYLFENEFNDYEKFMTLKDTTKYKVNAKYLEEAPNNIDTTHAGVMLGYIGTCEGCKKTYMGSIWGD